MTNCEFRYLFWGILSKIAKLLYRLFSYKSVTWIVSSLGYLICFFCLDVLKLPWTSGSIDRFSNPIFTWFNQWRSDGSVSLIDIQLDNQVRATRMCMNFGAVLVTMSHTISYVIHNFFCRRHISKNCVTFLNKIKRKKRGKAWTITL